MTSAFSPGALQKAPDDSVSVPVLTRYLGPDTVACLGPTLVVAPHADDESLACGGLIALLRDAAIAVGVVVVTDGRVSHPSAGTQPKTRHRAVRETETLRALQTLGVGTSDILFLRQTDGAVPANPGGPAFEAIVERLRRLFDQADPETIVYPFRADAHPDHRATFALVQAAAGKRRVRLLEYPVMLGAEAVDVLIEHDFTMWSLDISQAYERKLAALAAHRAKVATAPFGAELGTIVLEDQTSPVGDGPSETFFEFASDGLRGTGPMLHGESHEPRSEHAIVHESGTLTAGEVTPES